MLRRIRMSRGSKPMNRGKGFAAPLRCQTPQQATSLSVDVPARQGLNGRRRAINKRGPKTREWEAVRETRKRQFANKGIITCQARFAGCFFDNALGFAHPAKRRNLKEGEIGIVALLCNPCHDILEVGPPEEMRRFVESAFERTGVPL